MSPILLRPIREQFEHDRVIRLLQTRFRRRYVVGTNVGDEPEASAVKSSGNVVYPDLVLTNIDGAKRLHGVIEVETAESVNHLEAMAEWVPFAKARGAFYLYVPAGTTDVALRLCEDYKVPVTEIWSFHAVGDQMRFTMTYRSPRARRATKPAAAAAPRRTRPAKTRPTAPAKKEAKTKAKAGAKRAKKTGKLTPKKSARTPARKRVAKTATKKAVKRVARKTATSAARKGSAKK